MRIAYLCADRGIRYGGTKGAAVHMSELIAALVREGAEVLALVSGVATDAPDPPPGVSLEFLPDSQGRPGAAGHPAEDGHRRRWIEERLARFGPSLLYERLALHSAAGAGAAGRLGIPHAVELNAPLLAEARRYRGAGELTAADRMERATLAGADLVLAVSSPLAAYAERRGARRVEVLPNAVAIERHPRPRWRRGREPVAVFAGRVRPWHGMETVTAAWGLLGNRAPALVVVGEPGEARPALHAAGAKLMGPIPHSQVPAVLADADIALAPYAADAPEYFSPIKLFEYMAAGLAVIAADLPAVRELLSEETGVIVPKGDPQALARAVAALSADAPRRRRLGRAARNLVAAEHAWSHRARRILAAAAPSSAIDRELIRT
jgi:starch synthase